MIAPELSIIIPVYNGQDYIVRCMDSIMRQQGADQYEIIVVDDGSADDTPKILDAAASIYKNIRVIHQKNSGVSVARNNGIVASHGKYITFVDADDMVGLRVSAFNKYFKNAEQLLNKNFLEQACSVPNNLKSIICTNEYFTDTYFINMLHAITNTNADIVFGGNITINDCNNRATRQVYETDAIYNQSVDDKNTILIHASARESANFALYSRKFLDNNNLRFLANMKLNEDILFCLLSVLYANKVATVKDVTYFYNRHENTLSNITGIDEWRYQYSVANIQLYSVFLNELANYPDYAPIFKIYMAQFSKAGQRHKHNLENFPSQWCAFNCNKNNCTGCFIADGMREQFTKNIEKYLGVTR